MTCLFVRDWSKMEPFLASDAVLTKLKKLQFQTRYHKLAPPLRNIEDCRSDNLLSMTYLSSWTIFESGTIFWLILTSNFSFLWMRSGCWRIFVNILFAKGLFLVEISCKMESTSIYNPLTFLSAGLIISTFGYFDRGALIFTLWGIQLHFLVGRNADIV